jgi:hypothetical protein
MWDFGPVVNPADGDSTNDYVTVAVTIMINDDPLFWVSTYDDTIYSNALYVSLVLQDVSFCNCVLVLHGVCV